ncbi:fused response regulator/phosphatase [Streptomyces spinoverrucosus]|uniref:PP2C family protein-serine/threonine phosphatase n=1 Tax=Streptomyces spinoverrucosus TaxID=284043 RepID=UPI0018C35B89|nr:fused response regulator/phosphatase [Streptomyces spinoverrucosus]MBG0854305.1 fused response regulator/phosphatase [Streptomyces spinoverrucosus]
MPVPVPRQRAIPAVESGQAQAAPAVRGLSGASGDPGTEAPRKEAHKEEKAAKTTSTLTDTNLTLLLIEDDPGGSPIVPELLDQAGKPIRIRTARNLTEAERLLTDDVHCILLDLALPAPGRADDSDDELSVLRHVLELAPRHAVLALTASGDAERGAEAVRVGAQDYLFRDELDGRLLSRAIRYAVERKRSDTAERRLAEGRLRAQENRRLERGLLPTPLLHGSSLRFAARYRPGRSRALLGGDFYDVVRTPDGTVHAMIGDVCGHGPDEAALGVELRIAWRALTLAGLCGDELLNTLQQVLEHERSDDEIFATLCTVDIAPDGRRGGLCLAGHPAPLVARPGRAPRLLPYDNNGPALGLLPGARWPRMQVELGREWSLMLYTDGLIEGHIGEGRERLGQDGMVEMISRQLSEGLRGEALLRAAVSEVRDLNGGELTDDVAVLLLERA